MIPGPDGATERHSLFVYGALRRGFELHHHLARLGARFLAEAKVGAELIDRDAIRAHALRADEGNRATANSSN